MAVPAQQVAGATRSLESTWRLAQARGGEEIIAARLDPAPLRYVTWGSKSPQIFDHLEDRNLALYEEILKEARSRFEPGKRLSRVGA